MSLQGKKLMQYKQKNEEHPNVSSEYEADKMWQQEVGRMFGTRENVACDASQRF